MYRLPQCAHCFARQTLPHRSVWGSFRCKHVGLYQHHDGSSTSVEGSTFGCSQSAPSTLSRRWFGAPETLLTHAQKAVAEPQTYGNRVSLADEFGLLSVMGASSESVSTIGEANLIDHLLRSESSSGVSEWAFSGVPTTADANEMGGSSDGIALEECMEGLLGEGYDVGGILTDLHDVFAERSLGSPAVACTSSVPIASVASTSSADRLRDTIPGTRRVISEEMRRTMRLRKRDRKMSTLSASIPTREDREELKELIEEPVKKSRFDPEMDRPGCVTVEELEEAVESGDIQKLRDLLNARMWPPNCGHLISRTLAFAVENSADCDEASLFFRDCATSSPRAFVRDWVAIRLCGRVARERGVSACARALRAHRHVFMARPPADYRSDRSLASAFEDLIRYVSSTGTLKDCLEVFRAAKDSGFAVDDGLFVENVIGSMIESGKSFPDVVTAWKSLCESVSVVRGLHLLLDKVFCEEPRLESKRCDELLSFASESLHPFSCLSEVICALLKRDRTPEAKNVFSRVSISGRHFKPSVFRLAKQEDGLLQIERLAQLVSQCMFAERRKGGRRRQAEVAGDVEANASTSINDHLTVTLTKFAGVGKSKKKAGTEKEMKKHKINEQQLGELSELLQDVWIKLAERANDISAVDRLQQWCALNRVDMTSKAERIAKKIRKEMVAR